MTGASRPLPGELRLALVCAYIVAMGPISLSLIMPTMPALVQAFATSPEAAKATVVIYLAGYALAQLVCGPLSDAFGRRPVAFAFFGLYTAGSVAALMAPSIDWLLAGRCLQGIGAAAGIALSRAMVRDVVTGQRAAKVMNLIGIILAVGPAVSPAIGGAILSAFGWQAVFGVMVAYGIASLAIMGLAVPETNRALDRASSRPGRVARNYLTLIRDRTFMRPAVVLGCVLGGYYSLSVILPFAMIERVGVTPTQFGFLMILQTGSYFSGALLTSQLLRRFPARRLIDAGIVVGSAAALAWLVMLSVLPPSVLTVMGPIVGWAVGVALVTPGATTLALADYPHLAGSASALTGFLQIGFGLGGAFAGTLLGDPILAIRILLPAFAVTAALVHLGLRPRS